jgi:hypothetical protein
MKRFLLLVALALVPLAGGTSCFLALTGAAAGGGFIVSQQVLADDMHVAQVALDVDQVWPSVKETLGFYQEPGSELAVQDFPRTVHARVDGAKVVVYVEAIDIDRTTIRVSAEKYLTQNSATASEVMEGILERLQRS